MTDDQSPAVRAVDPDPGNDVAQATISWFRAIVTAVVVAVAGGGLLAYGTNAWLNHLTGIDRSQRVAVATIWFAVVLAGLAWVLRRLQQRGVL